MRPVIFCLIRCLDGYLQMKRRSSLPQFLAFKLRWFEKEKEWKNG